MNYLIVVGPDEKAEWLDALGRTIDASELQDLSLIPGEIGRLDDGFALAWNFTKIEPPKKPEPNRGPQRSPNVSRWR